MSKAYDVVVVGSGVNGMVAALLCRLRGLEVLLLESHTSLGGGVRSKALTLPGFVHDVCSAVHPFGRSSPILSQLNLEAEGLEWVDPELPLAHPLLNQPAVLMYRDLATTVAGLGDGGRAYSAVMSWLVNDWPHLEQQLLGPPIGLPAPHLLPRLARFGSLALTSATLLGQRFGERGAALWAGLAGHSLLPMTAPSSSAIACVLGLMAHRVGWPMPRGGSGAIAEALEKRLRSSGVEIQLETPVRRRSDLPKHRAVIYDLSAKQLLRVLGPLLPAGKRRALQRYRLGPGVFKVDYALKAPVPWSDPAVAKAGTVHVGGSLADITASERAVWDGGVHARPFLLAVQPSLFDPSRAPKGKHVLWVYMHVPNGWSGGGRTLVEAQMERFAPGFRETILAHKTTTVEDFEAYNPNYVGGDILGGANTLEQVVRRPFLSPDPYWLGGNSFCCSASVPPGGGVHGMGGYHAVNSALTKIFGTRRNIP